MVLPMELAWVPWLWSSFHDLFLLGIIGHGPVLRTLSAYRVTHIIYEIKIWIAPAQIMFGFSFSWETTPITPRSPGNSFLATSQQWHSFSRVLTHYTLLWLYCKFLLLPNFASSSYLALFNISLPSFETLL